MEHPGLYI